MRECSAFLQIIRIMFRIFAKKWVNFLLNISSGLAAASHCVDASLVLNRLA